MSYIHFILKCQSDNDFINIVFISNTFFIVHKFLANATTQGNRRLFDNCNCVIPRRVYDLKLTMLAHYIVHHINPCIG